MEGQGFAVVRRDAGRTYVAVDYGHRGGSHGHPDRLNLWLVLGDHRVFEDVGTGSYVEKTLHWYRSTLAHNAPLVDGRSQDAVSGRLRAWDERDGYTWIDAEASIAVGVLVRRTVVVGPGHLVDRLTWTSDRDVTVDVPMHIDAEVDGASWTAGRLSGEARLEDGFEFLSNTEKSRGVRHPVVVHAPNVHGVVSVDVDHEWWRAVAPGPPREPTRRFVLVRARGMKGCVSSAWSWSDPVSMTAPVNDVFDVRIGSSTYSHHAAGTSRQVTHDAVAVLLDGRRAVQTTSATTRTPEMPPLVISANPRGQPGARFELARDNYRRTEATWEEAGSPRATVDIGATSRELLIAVHVPNASPHFALPREENPLDNEHPDVNSDGVQLHLTAPGAGARRIDAAWLMVPERSPGPVRTSGRGDAVRVPIQASWSPSASGWTISVRIPRDSLGALDARVGIDVIVNEMPQNRERRRGQLVLSGRGGAWAYLRGDRQDPHALIPMVVRDE
jgi:hypothetical protein